MIEQAIAVEIDALPHRAHNLTVGPPADAGFHVLGDIADAHDARERGFTDVHTPRLRVPVHALAARTDRLYRRPAVVVPVALGMAVNALQHINSEVPAAFDQFGRGLDRPVLHGLLFRQVAPVPAGDAGRRQRQRTHKSQQQFLHRRLKISRPYRQVANITQPATACCKCASDQTAW